MEMMDPHIREKYEDKSVFDDAASIIIHNMKRQSSQYHFFFFFFFFSFIFSLKFFFFLCYNICLHPTLIWFPPGTPVFSTIKIEKVLISLIIGSSERGFRSRDERKRAENTGSFLYCSVFGNLIVLPLILWRWGS
jgi:hypothetical protein